MPLDKSGSKQSVKRNISELVSAGHAQRQAIAIAMDIRRRSMNKGDAKKKHAK